MENFRSGFMTIIGRPNVGKSTLMNYLVGQKIAIMSDKPQTTRNRIQGVLTGSDYQIVFLDTPGIHKPKHQLGRYMVEVALKSLQEVDGILHVLDASQEVGAGEAYILELLARVKTPVFLVINKIDLVPKNSLLAIIADMSRRYPYREIIPVSATTGENMDRLLSVLVDQLPPGPSYYPEGVVTDQPERFILAEIIREKVLLLTREEIPHAVAVQVEELTRRDENNIYLAAIIYVERDSQKGVIIGKNGKMLKEIGSQSRLEIENLLGNKVYLELWVKVKPGWRKRDLDLRLLGYDF
jgi:GTP-binding protein Era